MGGGTEAPGVLIVFLPRRALRSILGLLSDMAWFEPWSAGEGPALACGARTVAARSQASKRESTLAVPGHRIDQQCENSQSPAATAVPSRGISPGTRARPSSSPT